MDKPKAGTAHQAEVRSIMGFASLNPLVVSGRWRKTVLFVNDATAAAQHGAWIGVTSHTDFTSYFSEHSPSRSG